MDLWNRLAISLIALFVLVGAVVTLLVAAEALDPDFLPGGTAEVELDGGASSDSWFEPQLQGVADYSGSAQAITVAVSVAVALAMLAVVLLEILPVIRRPGALQISSTPEGALTIQLSSVRLLAEKTGISNRNISSLRCRLRVRRRPPAGGPASISIVCYPRLLLGSDVQEVRDDLQARVKEAVERLTGLAVIQVNVVRVRYDRGESRQLIGA